MSKVRTFQRVFPSYHPLAGKPTYFVEKVWKSLYLITGFEVNYKMICDLNPKLDADVLRPFWNSINHSIEDLKHHTIREKHHLNVGDWFSPRVWSGKPYRSKQIVIAPDIQVKSSYTFSIYRSSFHVDTWTRGKGFITKVAENDGLSYIQFLDWFKFPRPFDGQIICWNDQIKY